MTSNALRQPCPPCTCDCDRDALVDGPAADARILRLTLHEEKRLLVRLESITDLPELEMLQQRMYEQLGIVLEIGPGLNEVRTMRGIGFRFAPQAGLCRKTRKSIPAAIRRSFEAHPEIVYALLDSQDLLRGA
ncbi:MAG: hypothetical protein ACKVK5_17245 [Pseudomonadales bacterium]